MDVFSNFADGTLGLTSLSTSVTVLVSACDLSIKHLEMMNPSSIKRKVELR